MLMKIEVRDYYIDALNYSYGTDNKLSPIELRWLVEGLLQQFIIERFQSGCGDHDKLEEAIQKFD